MPQWNDMNGLACDLPNTTSDKKMFLYGTPFSGKTSPRLLCGKVWKQQTVPAFVVTTNGNASWFSKSGKSGVLYIHILDITHSFFLYDKD